MITPRISASSYSNTAPLIWSFLYGSYRGRAEVILDNAPARSAELLRGGRVDAALVPVIAYHTIDNARLVGGVCVGAKRRVESVCLVTCDGRLPGQARSVALDASSRTSAVLTKILFRDFFAAEPQWVEVRPDLNEMLSLADAALLIGDPALDVRDGEMTPDGRVLHKFDLAELWRSLTGLGFVFAMWMTTRTAAPAIYFADARDEGLEHIDEIVSNYRGNIALPRDAMRRYLTESISYTPDDEMMSGLKLYFELAEKHKFIERRRELKYL